MAVERTRVLVVDDMAANLVLVRALLPNAQFAVRSASTADAALESIIVAGQLQPVILLRVGRQS